jgi:DNA-binding PadR family transcriptional regulator
MDTYSRDPLKPAVLHILMALNGQARYGYDIVRAVREQSGGQIPLRTGTFYRHLSEVIAAGYVERVPQPKPDDDPRRGAYYRLTVHGRHRLATERGRLMQLAEAIAASSPRKGHA